MHKLIEISDVNIPGKVLSIMNLLPSLSMTKTAIKLPTALVKASGIFKIMPNYSLSSMFGKVIPESIII